MQSHPQSRPCSAQPDSVHWRTSSLHRPSSLYGNGLGNGPRLGSGRLGPEDVLVTPTGADMELVNGADSDQITPTYLLDANGYNVRVGPFPKTGEQVPVPQVLRCPTMTPRRAPRAPWKAQDVSHIMAPAVCISNPSNGTHNCRPGWRTCLGSTPSGSVPLYACACPKPPGRTKKAQVRLASPSERRGGFGTCGWTGAGRPRIRPTACSRRRHAGTSPRCTC